MFHRHGAWRGVQVLRRSSCGKDRIGLTRRSSATAGGSELCCPFSLHNSSFSLLVRRPAVGSGDWMTCKECGQVVKLTRTMNKCHSNTELSSLEETRCQFNGGTGAIKLGIDVHQDFYVVVEQAGGSNPKPPQRFPKAAFLHWAAKLKSQATEMYAVYEACGFGFSLQRKLSALSIKCYVVCPQKLDEQNRRVKTDGSDDKASCLKLARL